MGKSKLYGERNPMYSKKHVPEDKTKTDKVRTKFLDRYTQVHKESNKKLGKTYLEMGKLFDPHKQSSSLTKTVKGQIKSIYGWTLKEEVKYGDY